MANLLSSRIDLVRPCHSAPLVITTTIESHVQLSRDVSDEFLCAADRRQNSWDRIGVTSEWNTANGGRRIDSAEVDR